MADHQAELHHSYAERYLREQRHSVLQEAARDVRLTTPFLEEQASDRIRKERAGKEHDVPNSALLVLQQRTDLEAALLLTRNHDAAKRQLGALILREFPRLDSAPSQHSPRVIRHLEKLLETETDEDVFDCALSAIGWQCLSAGTEVLLRFVDHQRACVRRIVANNLLMGQKTNPEMPPRVMAALLKFAEDSEASIRRSVFYDIGEYPEYFQPYHDAFKPAAHKAKEDPNPEVREQAWKAYVALS